MRSTNRARLATLLCLIATGASANTFAPDCFRPEVQAHVRQLIGIYGPMSNDHEFFGFIYSYAAKIDSAVVRSRPCMAADCVVDVTVAGQRIPPGATVLGEWHTHPRNGSWELSTFDVLGAHRNANVECYAAYFSRPNGEILAWNPRKSSVPDAMASLLRIGTYAPYRG
jgi:hypothetical protein